MNIKVRNCVRITRIPLAISSFQWLETLDLEYCTIPVCCARFPESLRNLRIAYSCMRLFEPEFINLKNLAKIDLSFNNLRRVPLVLKSYRGRERSRYVFKLV